MSNLPREPGNCKSYNYVSGHCPASFRPRVEICRACNRWVPFNKDNKRVLLKETREKCEGCGGCPSKEDL